VIMEEGFLARGIIRVPFKRKLLVTPFFLQHGRRDDVGFDPFLSPELSGLRSVDAYSEWRSGPGHDSDTECQYANRPRELQYPALGQLFLAQTNCIRMGILRSGCSAYSIWNLTADLRG